MNTISISNATVIEYSNANPCGFIKKENQFGIYCCFRIMEKNYNSRPNLWLCIANNHMAEKLEKMKLEPGDEVIISGTTESYDDVERNRESKRIIVYDIDYNYAAKKKNKNKAQGSSANETPAETPMSVSENTIDLDQCDLFQKEINVK